MFYFQLLIALLFIYFILVNYLKKPYLLNKKYLQFLYKTEIMGDPDVIEMPD
jgi:hypothetical protein